MRTLRIQLPDELEEELEHEARTMKRESSEVAREAITLYLHGRRRSFRRDLLRAARAIGRGSDALETAEESLPLDNEALDLAEGSASVDRPADERGRGR